MIARIIRVGRLAVPALIGAGIGYSVGRTEIPFLPKPPLPIPSFSPTHGSGRGNQFGISILTYGLLFLTIIMSLLLLRKK
jgi:hypothetical protein